MPTTGSSRAYVFRVSPQAPACIEASIDLIGRLSRTFKGESNTDVSALKEPLLLTGNGLQARVRLNFKEAAGKVLLFGPHDLRCETDAESLLYEVAAIANQGLLAPERSLFRTWETGIPHHACARDVQNDFQRCASELLSRWQHSFVEPISFSAWIEQRMNARGHHFTDGCGRIARAFSVATLARRGLVYPHFTSREEYFTLIERDEQSWCRAYKMRVAAITGITQGAISLKQTQLPESSP